MKSINLIIIFAMIFMMPGCTTSKGSAEPEIIPIPREKTSLSRLESINADSEVKYGPGVEKNYIEFLSETSENLWSLETGSKIASQFILHQSRLYFTNENGTLYCVQPETGEITFKFESGGLRAGSPVVYGDQILFLNGSGDLIAVNSKTGEEVQRLTLEANFESDQWDYFLSTPLIHTGTLYVGSGTDKLYSINLQNFQINWIQTGNFMIHSKPLIQDGILVYGDMSGSVIGADPESGRIIWRSKTTGSIMGNFTYYDGAVYFGSRDARIHALNIQDGQEIWNFDYNPAWIMATPVIWNDSVIVCGSDSHHIQALDAQTGEEKWIIYVPHNIAGTPLVQDDLLYVTGGDSYNKDGLGSIMQIDPDTGTPLFRFTTTSAFSSPAVFQNIAFIGNEKGTVYGVNLP